MWFWTVELIYIICTYVIMHGDFSLDLKFIFYIVTAVYPLSFLPCLSSLYFLSHRSTTFSFPSENVRLPRNINQTLHIKL